MNKMNISNTSEDLAVTDDEESDTGGDMEGDYNSQVE